MKKYFISTLYLAGFISILSLFVTLIRKQSPKDNITFHTNKESDLFVLETKGKRLKNILVRNIDNDTISLKKLIGKNTFVIYNPMVSCQPCLDSLVALSSEVFSGLEDHIIILSRFYTLRDIKFFSLKNNTKISIYDIISKNPENKLEKSNKSMGFLCDSTMIINNLFVYQKGSANQMRQFLSRIRKIIANGKNATISNKQFNNISSNSKLSHNIYSK